MKNILKLLIFIISVNVFSQTPTANLDRNDLLGVWEWHNGNEIFRLNFFNYTYQYEGLPRTSLSSHFTMLTVDPNGNESILYTSDRPMEGTNEHWMPMIRGGSYLDYNNSYRFSLSDNTTNSFLLGVLYLKFLNTPTGSPLQNSWKLEVDGMASVGENFNVPRDIILIKQ